MKTPTRFSVTGTLLTAVLASFGASAQPDVREDAADVRADARADAYIEEIVVTAQHRDRSEREVNISMAVFTRETISELAIASGVDVARQTPGFTLTDSGGLSVPVYTLRGVGFDDHQPNSSSTVGVYVDEVAQPYPVMTAGLRHDLERIELLKGPQGDLYGRNTTGGALRYVANRPTDGFDAGMSVGAGNYETLEVRGFLNGPLSERVSGRIAAAGVSRNQGWQENEITGSDAGAYDEFSVRAMVDIAATDDLDIQLTVRTERFDGEPQTPQSTVVLPSSNATAAFLNGIGLYPLPGLDPLMVADQSDAAAARWDLSPRHEREQTGFSGVVDWRIGSLTLTSVTGYEVFERTIALDWDGTPARLLGVNADTEIESFTQEFRLASADDAKLTWLVGAYFSSDTVEDVSHYDDSESPTVGFTFGSDSRQETDSAALFGHGSWSVNEHFRFNLGGRYTSETRSMENCTVDTGDGSAVTALLTFQALGMLTLTNPEALTPGGCVHLEGVGTSTSPPAPDVRIPGVHKDEIETDQATGRVGIDWLPNDDWLVFGHVSTGFKSGGYNMFSALVVDQFAPYDEEQLTAFEVGFKGKTLTDRLMLTGSLFQYDYEDKQVSTFIPDQLGIFPGLVGIQNVPDSRIRGIELGADWLVTGGLSLTANVSFLDTEIRDYEGAFDVFNQQIFDASGQPLPNAPEVAYQLMGAYERVLMGSMLVRMSLAYSWQDESYSQISAIDAFQVDAFGVLDGRITAGPENGRWNVSFWGRNLADESYGYSNALAQDNVVRYTGMPRTYGLAFNYNLD